MACLQNFSKSDCCLRHICPSVRPEQLCCHWTHCHKTLWYESFNVFFKSIKVHFLVSELYNTFNLSHPATCFCPFIWPFFFVLLCVLFLFCFVCLLIAFFSFLYFCFLFVFSVFFYCFVYCFSSLVLCLSYFYTSLPITATGYKSNCNK